MTHKQLSKVIKQALDEVMEMRDAGQKEYARADNNVFANFERVASYTGVSRANVLSVYLLKHLDGILAYVNGHKSQREDVRGRITDSITYLLLLRGMIEDDENN